MEGAAFCQRPPIDSGFLFLFWRSWSKSVLVGFPLHVLVERLDFDAISLSLPVHFKYPFFLCGYFVNYESTIWL